MDRKEYTKRLESLIEEINKEIERANFEEVIEEDENKKFSTKLWFDKTFGRDEELDARCLRDYLDWVVLCEGKTKQEINELGHLYSDSWFK